jgi:hypothetical protein
VAIGVVANPLHRVRRMRLFLATCALLPLAACAARYRTELVGQGNALVVPRQAAAATADGAAVAAPGAGGIQLPQGSYDLSMQFDIPRAQRIEWRVQCPGADLVGAVGEPYDAYRARRLDELRAQREREHARLVAAARSVVVEAAPPPPPRPRGVVRVRTPAGELIVVGSAQPAMPPVSPPLPPAVVAEPPPVEQVTELPPGDTGRGRLGATIRVDTSAPGVCAITAATDDANVLASFQVVRVHDLRAEARQTRTAQHTGAIELRTRVRSQLVAFGADETARQRRLEAQARVRAEADARAELQARARAQLELRAHVEVNARAEAELRVTAEADARRRQARIDAEDARRARLEREAWVRWNAEAPQRARAELVVRWRTQAYATRESVIGWLVTQCHADPGRRANLELQARAERDRVHAERVRIREERELQIRLRLEARDAERARIRAERDERAAREAQLVAELEHRRIDDALRVRVQLTGALVAMGARLRPPRPEAPFENPGSPPFDGARWTAGSWAWSGTQWAWTAGGWTDPDSFGATGGDVVVRVDRAPEVGPAIIVRPVVNPTVTLSAPDGYAPVPGGEVRGQGTITIIRDHRPAPPPAYPPVRVRDHRDAPSAPDRRPVVRDHRTKPAPTVRDHRR